MQGSSSPSVRVRPPHTDEDDAHAAQTPFASLRTPGRTPYSQHEAMTRDARHMQDTPRCYATGGQTLLSEIVPQWRGVTKISKKGQDRLEMPPGFGATLWRPLLRGAMTDAYQPYSQTLMNIGYREIHCDGLMEIGFGACGELPLPPDYPLVMMANLVQWVNQTAKHATVPMVEYAVDVEVRAVGESPRTGLWSLYQRAKSIGCRSLTDIKKCV